MTSSDIYALDMVRQHFATIATSACEQVRRILADELVGQNAPGAIDSPLEAIFEFAWTAQHLLGGSDVRQLALARQFDIVCDDGTTYRADFAVFAWMTMTNLRLAVELDGHEWHERTPTQVEYRNRRDRRLQRVGWRVLHFSGAELLRDPMACVDEVMLDAALALSDRVQTDAR